MRASMIAALTSALASPALGLSCEPPNLLDAFREAQASPESYTVLHGRLDFDPALLAPPPSDDPNNVLPPPPILARFEGDGLGRSGFVPSEVTAVTLEVDCIIFSCGLIDPGDGHLLFARMTAEGPVVAVGPCRQWTFRHPSRADLAGVAACMAGRGCAP